jgi:hypothetical protein
VHQGEIDRDVRLHVYSFFVERGHPPVAAETAAALGIEPAEAEAAYRRLADTHVLVLAPGTPYVWMANPLSAIPTPFRVEAPGRTWWGNCIWDALGVVSMFGGDGTVTTPCPDCADEIRVDVRDRALHDPDPDHVLHFSVPARRWWDDIGFT